MKRLVSIFVSLMLLLVSSVSFANTDISNGVVVAEGVSLPGQTTSNGYRGAKLDAMRNLLEQVGSVRIDSQTIVKDSIIQSDVIKTQINGLVKGAKLVEKFQDEYGYYHVVMELPVYGATNSLAATVLPKRPQVAFPEPESIIQVEPVAPSEPTVQPVVPVKPKAEPEQKTTVPQVQTTTTTVITSTTIIKPNNSVNPDKPEQNPMPTAVGIYTGVIIDCQGLGLQPAMAPAVFTANRKVVYGAENFSHEDVISKGYVGYANSTTSGVERAGSNPLVIKATNVEGSCSPIISEADAAKILQENKVTGFLNKGNVVLVR